MIRPCPHCGAVSTWRRIAFNLLTTLTAWVVSVGVLLIGGWYLGPLLQELVIETLGIMIELVEGDL